MGYVVRMPKLGLEMEQGTLLEWAVDRDEPVSEGDLIAEIESEKSIGEIDAREDGVLRRTYLDVGDAAPPGTPIGIVAAADADIADLEAEAEAELSGASAEGEDGAAVADESDPESAPASPEADAADEAAADESTAGSDVKASPRARKRAEELGVDLATVEPTGPQGSVTADDVEAAAEGGTDADAGAEDVKASPRARKRAEELGVDLATVEPTGPQGSVTADDVEAAAKDEDEDEAEAGADADVDAAAEPRRLDAEHYRRETAVLDADAADSLFDATTAAREAVDEDASVTDVVLLVATAALSACPRCNGTYADATHQIHEDRHVSVLTDGSSALVPAAGARSLSEVIEARRTEVGADAPTPTFTLSNAAGEGGGRVVNPPAVAALAFDPVGQRATPTADGVRLDRLVTLSVTYDARALAPSDARAFLDAVAAAADRAPALVTESYLD
jgi:pyruvate/2-oxoglutarate dehydrogenase complex dihydrolipoamide acyltransferase (E2) component